MKGEESPTTPRDTTDASQHVTNPTTKSRKLLALLGPALFIWAVWLFWAINADAGKYFTNRSEAGTERPRYFMSVTMAFGSFVAGITSEGGAAIAFPIMTLLMGVKPNLARDFGLAIQSVGMTAAGITIIGNKVMIDQYSLLWCSLGGAPGILTSLLFLDDLDPKIKKLGFVSIWLGFAIVLLAKELIVIYEPYNTTDETIKMDLGCGNRWSSIGWKIVLISFGFLGGMLTGLTGSGIDICCFSCITLLMNVNERTATPTSVILMAINSILGLFVQSIRQVIHKEVWAYWAICVPIVVLGAPLGSFVGSFLRKRIIIAILITIDLTQFIGAWLIIKPWKHSLVFFSIVALLLSILVFCIILGLGHALHTPDSDELEALEISDKNASLRLKAIEIPNMGTSPEPNPPIGAISLSQEGLTL